MKQNWPGVTFPGGHIEKNESFHDAVVREVFEETGPHYQKSKTLWSKAVPNC
ncbi:NUDIX domain-containing protein [Salinicoccus sesuvii]|uniref:NUDIX domain-containing protein n=1 Tax=Salinicoccus sesuvii TaxID=868281 RepID=A0ABV7NAQ9_9STAP